MKAERRNRSREIFCLNCAHVFLPKKVTSARSAVCPECGHRTNLSEFDELYGDAARVLRYGHLYRAIFERQIKEQPEIKSMASLADAPYSLVFATVAALSGIIGNASYDLIKNIIRRLQGSHPERYHYGNLKLKSEQDIQVFIRHTREYVDDLTDVDEKIKGLIREEERADVHGEQVAKAMKGVDTSDGETVSAIVRSVARKIRSEDTPRFNRKRMQQLLSEVWNELPD
jgi:uncharacterized OB-fold protein